jgi:hypothetical protein
VHSFHYSNTSTVASVRDRSHTVLNGVAFESLRVVGNGVKHSYDGKEIKLYWDTPFEPRDDRTVTLEYDVDHPVSGLFYDRKDWMPESNDKWVVTDHETEKYINT